MKRESMHLLKRSQLQHECNTLRRLLFFLKEENVALKNRLSQILKESFNKNLLEEAETFHSAFIKADERMYLLRNDLAGLDSLLEKAFNGKNNVSVEIDIKLRELRHNITTAENQFIKMQSDFNSYFYEKI